MEKYMKLSEIHLFGPGEKDGFCQCQCEEKSLRLIPLYIFFLHLVVKMALFIQGGICPLALDILHFNYHFLHVPRSSSRLLEPNEE